MKKESIYIDPQLEDYTDLEGFGEERMNRDGAVRMDILLASDLEKGELTELQASGEVNYQKVAESICKQEGHVWKETNADCESGTSDLECERCHKFQVLHW